MSLHISTSLASSSFFCGQRRLGQGRGQGQRRWHQQFCINLHPIKISNVFIKSFFGAQQPPVESPLRTQDSSIHHPSLMERLPVKELRQALRPPNPFKAIVDVGVAGCLVDGMTLLFNDFDFMQQMRCLRPTFSFCCRFMSQFENFLALFYFHFVFLIFSFFLTIWLKFVFYFVFDWFNSVFAVSIKVVHKFFAYSSVKSCGLWGWVGRAGCCLRLMAANMRIIFSQRDIFRS